MLLIFPPVAKPSEPPAGIARLSGSLAAHGILPTLLDANLEGLLSLLQRSPAASDTWTRRAAKHALANLAALRSSRTYQSFDRYSRAVKDVNRVLEMSAKESGVTVGLADYQDSRISPLSSTDLIEAAKNPQKNPFYPWFSVRLPQVLEQIMDAKRRERCGETHETHHDEGTNKANQTVVGFSLNYLSQAFCTFSMIGFLKKNYAGVKIILGGGLVSSWMKKPGWENPFSGLVNHIISGPGERPLLQISGVRDLQEHYRPDYDHLPLEDYLSPGWILPYSASSGCYWNKCLFCPEAAENNPYASVAADKSLADLSALTSRKRPSLVHLLDNSISPALMHALADKPLGVPWYGFARINNDLADRDFCVALKRSGCAMLKLGLESGDQYVLDRMQKGIDLKTASRVLKNLQEVGISAYIYLVFGTPAESIVEARKTLDFVVTHRNAITYLNLAIFNMPLCGREAELYGTETFYEGDLSLYTGFSHPRGFNRKIVRQFLEDEFKRHPAVAAILRNDPPIFTSNHAALFGPRKAA